MHSMPQEPSFSRRPGSLKRATPMTRLPGAARLARRARVGPILPPTPRIMRSPGSAPSSAWSAGDGTVITSSSWSSSAKRSGQAAVGPVMTSCLLWHRASGRRRDERLANRAGPG